MFSKTGHHQRVLKSCVLSMHDLLPYGCLELTVVQPQSSLTFLYVFFLFCSSSSQSLSNHEFDTPLTRSIGSPSSVESLTGCYVTSNSPGSFFPRATCSQKENSPLTLPYQKGQTHTYTHPLSSVTNPPLPIPIVLINGLPEECGTPTQLSRSCSSSFKDKMPKTNFSSFSGVNGLNNSYSDNSSSSTSSLDGKLFHPSHLCFFISNWAESFILKIGKEEYNFLE